MKNYRIIYHNYIIPMFDKWKEKKKKYEKSNNVSKHMCE